MKKDQMIEGGNMQWYAPCKVQIWLFFDFLTSSFLGHALVWSKHWLQLYLGTPVLLVMACGRCGVVVNEVAYNLTMCWSVCWVGTEWIKF